MADNNPFAVLEVEEIDDIIVSPILEELQGIDSYVLPPPDPWMAAFFLPLEEDLDAAERAEEIVALALLDGVPAGHVIQVAMNIIANQVDQNDLPILIAHNILANQVFPDQNQVANQGVENALPALPDQIALPEQNALPDQFDENALPDQFDENAIEDAQNGWKVVVPRTAGTVAILSHVPAPSCTRSVEVTEEFPWIAKTASVRRYARKHYVVRKGGRSGVLKHFQSRKGGCTSSSAKSLGHFTYGSYGAGLLQF